MIFDHAHKASCLKNQQRIAIISLTPDSIGYIDPPKFWEINISFIRGIIIHVALEKNVASTTCYKRMKSEHVDLPK